ncbi:hypothetical protein [Deinococcus aluminii]|uniref:Uncharacterized protein n=1 Tax=Deinococcus aluminii TaxID=1656885 RepID=A0ABP9X9E3_9DEIO
MPDGGVLHGRLLDALTGREVPAAFLARHALGARRWQEAFALSLQASEDARAVLALREAEAFREQARRLLTTYGGPLSPGAWSRDVL